MTIFQIKNLTLTGGFHLEDLSLNFTYLPSSRAYEYSAVELIPGGTQMDVTLDNLEEYSELTLKFCLDKGINKQLEAFYKGFTKVGIFMIFKCVVFKFFYIYNTY